MYFQIGKCGLRLAGSLHLFPPSKPDVPSWLRRAYQRAEVLYFEAPVGEEPAGARLRRPLTLDAVLPADVVIEMHRNFPPEFVKHLQPFSPWWAMINIMIALGGTTAPGTELQMRDWASADGKPIRHLEAADTVSTLLQALQIDVFAEPIRFLATHTEAPAKAFQGMYAAWIERNVDAMMDARSQAGLSGFRAWDHVMFDVRNDAWMKTLEELATSTERTLVVVGAGHLHGRHGLPALLAERGNFVTLVS